MKILRSQAGFSAIEIILALAVIGLVGFIGWRVYDQNKSAPNSGMNQQAGDTTTPIEKAEDLDTAATELNSQDIDEQLDTAEIDAALAE